VEVPSSVDSPDFIPSHKVTDALGDLQVAVWAHPGFTVVCIGADAGLSRVLDTAFDLGSTQTKSNGI
jgi:hypothetical protein